MDVMPFILNIVFVVVTFALLPFINYFVLPLRKHSRLKEVDGKIELNTNLRKAFSDIKLENDRVILKRAEGVQRVGVILFYKRGILCVKKHYYLELAQDEVSIAKLAKGKLFRIVVTEVDGVRSYKGISYGVNMPLLIITTVLQFAALFTFTLLLGISFSQSLDNVRVYNFLYSRVDIALDQRYKFYVLPLILTVVIPLVGFIAQLIALRGKAIRKEVK